MGGIIVKAERDHDLYVEWSTIVEAPTFIGTRVETIKHLMKSAAGLALLSQSEQRLARADEKGSSSAGDYAWFGSWDHDGFVVEQRGYLPRSRLREFLLLYAVDDKASYQLLDPFEDGYVRRD